MLNKIFLMGRMVRDPEVRSTTTGKTVTSFTIACERDGKEKQTDFFDVTAWNQTGDFVKNYFGKGRMIVVVGRLQTRKWEDKDGKTRTAFEVVAESVYFADSKTYSKNTEKKPAGGAFVEVDDDGMSGLPF